MKVHGRSLSTSLDSTARPGKGYRNDGPENLRPFYRCSVNVGAVLKVADFSTQATSATLVGDGAKKTVDLGLVLDPLNLQPGNNWIVAADCSQAELDGIVFGADGRTLKKNSPSGQDWPAQKQTPMLTLWRYLHAEIDCMGDPDFTTATVGQSRFESGAATRLTASTVQLTLGGTNSISSYQTGQFEGGRLELLAGGNVSLGQFDVTNNTTGGTPTITVTGVVPTNTANFRELIDDDINNNSSYKVDSWITMLPYTNWWDSRLDPGLVAVKLWQPEVQNHGTYSVVFDVHVGDSYSATAEKVAIGEIIAANRGSASYDGDRGFWVVYLLGAFQGRVDLDHDPSSSSPLFGISNCPDPPDATKTGILIYAETTRDYVESTSGVTISPGAHLKATSIHEVGHLFGMDDGPGHGPIMHVSNFNTADTPEEQEALQFNGAGLRKVMLTRSPGYDPQ